MCVRVLYTFPASTIEPTLASLAIALRITLYNSLRLLVEPERFCLFFPLRRPRLPSQYLRIRFAFSFQQQKLKIYKRTCLIYSSNLDKYRASILHVSFGNHQFMSLVHCRWFGCSILVFDFWRCVCLHGEPSVSCGTNIF